MKKKVFVILAAAFTAVTIFCGCGFAIASANHSATKAERAVACAYLDEDGDGICDVCGCDHTDCTHTDCEHNENCEHANHTHHTDCDYADCTHTDCAHNENCEHGNCTNNGCDGVDSGNCHNAHSGVCYSNSSNGHHQSGHHKNGHH